VKSAVQEKRTTAGCLWVLCLPFLIAVMLLLAPAFGPRMLSVGRLVLALSNSTDSSYPQGFSYQKHHTGNG